MAQINIPQPVRGTQSLLGDEAERFHAVVSAFERVRRLFGFRRVEVPVLEPTAVFARSLGETTDVVSKEMYSFEDRGGDSITLRPEFTAGIARAFLSEGWQQYAPLKVATHGPAFRYERPQKGRFRQFHQLDAEILGAAEPQADVEVLLFADQLLKELGIGDGAVLKLNTLGDPETRGRWRDALYEHFRAAAADLSEESRDRLERNPLRILDSKAHVDWPVVDAAPPIDDFLTPEAADFFAAVTAGLDAAGVTWERAPRLVRGLDYYRHTAFEFMTDRLGAQGTVLAGGRYDGLIEALGGPHTPAIGWAAGIERLSMMIDAPAPEKPAAVLVPMGAAGEAAAVRLLADLRRAGIAADMAFRGNMKKRMARAAAAGAAYAVILGDAEVESGTAQVKDLATGEQRAVALDLIDTAVTA
ncbi:histidine--tRNA ligase [Sphingomonas sp. BN140010]|uniref:Histidine--tRNA ligase n=1 Tax=Sphingomonas arvum TaxID=2992113 RepID=A0ABT3JEZ5_9SPHN|nr:histidine--tRNA ligase [Sphingomonas sp. BN140010]MCW3797637.1 histidine--tRNA ligase [Sphingomonas sp. BN140010]